MTRVRPAEVRYYVDADVLGLAKVLAGLRADVTYPGDPGALIQRRQRPSCPITSTGDPDERWLPVVAERRWLIISRDRHIQARYREMGAVKDHEAKLVVLAATEARSTFEQLEIVMCQWRKIARLADQPGPFIYTATRTSLEQVNLYL